MIVGGRRDDSLPTVVSFPNPAGSDTAEEHSTEDTTVSDKQVPVQSSEAPHGSKLRSSSFNTLGLAIATTSGLHYCIREIRDDNRDNTRVVHALYNVSQIHVGCIAISVTIRARELF
ncbi:hypothetical protein FQR65_LT06896 [Abscondita terminalis]|nr:hypothetical protein FQR65_LT06896 [Abscondita terminalis]